MVDPRPIRLTQIDEADYKSELDPAPFVVVGPIPGGAGAGVQSIVAGSNVTVDDSDPQNPVISATGGGGGTGNAIQSADGSSGVTASNNGILTLSAAADGKVEVTVISNTNGHAAIIADAQGNPVDSSIVPSGIVLHADLDNAMSAAESSLDDLSDIVATKASTADMNAALSGKASAEDLDNVFTIATNAVPNTRTVAGKPLSANISLDKVDVGLSNVDNISAANMPVSTAQQTALNLKANSADVVPNTRTVAGKALSSNITLAKGDVGLGNVDNTSDANKPVSTAQATAINAKVGSPNSTITGLAYYPTVASLPATGTAGVIYYVDAV